MLQDFQFAWRSFARNPAFALTAVLVLALGIGLNSAMFSVIEAVILRPLPFPQSDRLVDLWEQNPKRNGLKLPVPVGNYQDWRQQTRTLSSMAGFSRASFNLASETEPERYLGARSDAGFFSTLEVQPWLGHAWSRAQDYAGSDAVVVLSHRLWKTRFGADPHILGRQLKFTDTVRTVIGVMPAGFRYPEDSDMWAPLGFTPENIARRDLHTLTVFGRIKPGLTLAQVRSEFATIVANLDARFPDINAGEEILANPMLDDLAGDLRRPLAVLLCAVAFVLLIACANVANLLLVKATERRRELALRTSLGAPRARLIRQLLTENLLLSSAGALFGLALAAGVLYALPKLAPANIPRLDQAHLSWPVVLFTLALSIVTGLLCGYIPAWQASRAEVGVLLQEGSRGNTARFGFRSVLVVTQVVAAVILLTGAGLLVRSFSELLHVDLGMNPAQLETMRITPAPSKFAGHPELQVQLARNVLSSLSHLPGITNAALATDLPLLGNPIYIMRFEGHPVTPAEAPLANFFSVSPSYFETARMRFLEGHSFTDADTASTPLVAVVNQTFANRYFPGQSVIGKRLEIGFSPQPRWRQIVGVVADVRTAGLDQDSPVQVYVDYLQLPGLFPAMAPAVTFIARTSGDPAHIAASMRSAILSTDRSQPVYAVQTMNEALGKSVAQRRFSLLLLAAFALFALALAAIGLYAVMSYSVTQRTAEIGVRMALGASRSQVLLQIERQGMLLVGIGLVLGAAGAFALTRLMRQLLFRIAPHDPQTFTAAILVLLTVAALACYLPARRAAQVDPMIALRHQ